MKTPDKIQEFATTHGVGIISFIGMTKKGFSVYQEECCSTAPTGLPVLVLAKGDKMKIVSGIDSLIIRKQIRTSQH